MIETSPVPTVSVVIPVRDDAVELAVCLRLLAGQEVPPLEVVVVDNGSCDDSAAVARAAGARVVPEPRVGIPSAAATGYDAARGEVIARLDADSRPGPDWVAQVARATTDPRVDAVTGTGSFHDLPPGLRQLATWVYLGAYFALTHLALGHPPLWGSSMAVRRSSWERVRDQVHTTADVHDDLDLAFVLGPTSVIRVVPALRVRVSGRSVRGLGQLRRRMARAVTTLRLNWAVSPPWERWQARLSAGRSRSSAG
ncbi:glycosyltransferase [Nocardioides campestrisoli]|uniref:glycosyltransferase n=1 Tax=Nocardioides campestrisoli TaxID=2736757 RepID=UPI001C6315EF|nr:glycosyltransferase family 2 protein [Nocardioides campestrisoli]